MATTEVQLLISLIGGARLVPPMPSQQWQQRTGLGCVSSSTNGNPKHGTSAAKVDYLPLAPEASSRLITLWRNSFRARLDAPRSWQRDEQMDTEEEEENDVLGWLRELLLTVAEQEALVELAKEAPSLVQLHRVFHLFGKMSAAHRVEIKTAAERRQALPMRRDQIAEDKKTHRRQHEAFRREQMALRTEWQGLVAAAGLEKHCIKARKEAGSANTQMLLIHTLFTDVVNEREICLRRRRWHLCRDEIMRSCANDPLWRPEDAQKICDAILSLIDTTSIPWNTTEKLSTGPTQSQLTPETCEEYLVECAALCGAGAQAAARAGKRLWARRSSSAAVQGNGSHHWQNAATLWQRQHQLLVRLHGEADKKCLAALSALSIARANAELAGVQPSNSSCLPSALVDRGTKELAFAQDVTGSHDFVLGL